MHTMLTIARADPRPMYLQLMEQIRRRIAVGDWQPGQEIPSIRAVAAATKVSVITVKRAFLELEREGVLVTRQGRGTFVASNLELGRDLRRRELDEHVEPAGAIAGELGIKTQDLADRLREIVERQGETAKWATHRSSSRAYARATASSRCGTSISRSTRARLWA